MAIDYQRILPVLEKVASERLVGIENIDSIPVDSLQKELQERFSEQELVQAYSHVIGVPYAELVPGRINKDLFYSLPEKTMSRYQFVPFAKEGNVISLALYDPFDYNTLQAIKFLFRDSNETFQVFIAPQDDIQKVLDSFQNLSAEVKNTLSQMESMKGKEDDNIVQLDTTNQSLGPGENIENTPIIKIVSVILKNAVEGRASDIHIEGTGVNVRVRFRVDGVLHTSLILPKDVYSAIVARIKILSNLKIDEQRKPQDGRFSILEGEKKVDFRVSTFPTEHGEKVVLRILDTSKGILPLIDLGFRGPKAKLIEESILKPYGMVLVTGPTGSGKSTTLYTLLSMVNNEEINIVTLEDPIEYFISGVNQSQVKPEINYTFASGLRSILRQDPDIIMVGEIRDGETAGLAVQSALTGHLVFSTLHTNDSVGAVPRLQDMGVEPFLLSASLELIVAQRLVRKLCDKCKRKVEMSEKVRSYIHAEFTYLSEEFLSQVVTDGITHMYEPVGCEYCKDGFKGRMSVFETLPITEEMQGLIEKGAQEDEIYEYLRKNDFVTLKQDGLFKVLTGDISLEELLTVVEQ